MKKEIIVKNCFGVGGGEKFVAVDNNFTGKKLAVLGMAKKPYISAFLKHLRLVGQVRTS